MVGAKSRSLWHSMENKASQESDEGPGLGFFHGTSPQTVPGRPPLSAGLGGFLWPDSAALAGGRGLAEERAFLQSELHPLLAQESFLATGSDLTSLLATPWVPEPSS